jgi:hypothetical protein
VYFWSGNTSISWNGQTWLGLGDLLSISVQEDGTTVEARGISLTISGFNPTLLTDCLSDYKLGEPVNVYLGVFSSGYLISSPICAWSGRTDQPTIDFDGTKASITIACENRLVDLNRAVDRRWTHDDQQRDNPGDLAFFFVDQLVERNLFWGSYPISNNNI